MDSDTSGPGWSADSEMDGKQPPADGVSRQAIGSFEKGFASLLIVLLLATFSAFGLEAYLKAQAESRMAKREALSRQALYASEGGLEWAKAELSQNPLFAEGTRTVGEGTVTVQVTKGEGGYWVTSDAQMGSTRRKIQVFLYQDQARWVMSDYQEIYQ